MPERSRARTPAMAALCGLLAVAPFFGLFRPNTYLGLVDVLPYLVPLRHSAARALADGGLPWWDSYIQCGQSLCGNPISGVFYPPFLLSLALPGWAGDHLSLACSRVGVRSGVSSCNRTISRSKRSLSGVTTQVATAV